MPVRSKPPVSIVHVFVEMDENYDSYSIVIKHLRYDHVEFKVDDKTYLDSNVAIRMMKRYGVPENMGLNALELASAYNKYDFYLGAQNE